MRMPRAVSGAAVAFALLLLSLEALAVPPRPISDAERAGVEIATDYLSRGPNAIAERLASNSRLRSLQGQQLSDEIEARLGPWAGARWELQTVVPALADKAAAFSISFPSGVDDTAIFELTNEGGVFGIADIKTLAMPSDYKPMFAAAAPAAKPVEEKRPASTMPIAGGIVASALGIVAALTRRRQRMLSRVMLVAAAGMIVTFGAMTALRQVESTTPKQDPVVAKADDAPRLGSLVAMRRAMTTGGSGMAGTLPAGCRHKACFDAAALWGAQAELQQMHLDAAEKVLEKYPSPATIPLAEILRGRVALVKNKEADSAAAYEHAVNLGPGRDALWYETAQALMSLGYEDRAKRYLARLQKVGSREPDAYYTLSILSARKQKEEAVAYLQRAWNMRPARREQIVHAAALWSVIRDPAIVPLISLSAPKEATLASTAASSRSIVLPQGAAARMSGEFLHVQIGEAELFVHGGAVLAPAGTPVVDAGTWARDEDERGLREFPQLTTVARTAGAMAQPDLRRRVLRAANALANHNRWSDLANLTDGLSTKSELVPPEMFFLRSKALQRVSRTGEGRALLYDLAKSNVLQRRRDASALEELGEMLASLDQYDIAINAFDRAQSIRNNPFIDDRVRQLQMNKRLATKYSTYRSPHFVVQYPDDVTPASGKQIADIAEAEFQRMQKWIAVPDPQPIVINVVWWSEFRDTYTGSDFIVGFYNGKVTVPLAGVPVFIPPIVTILTHEVAHAMIAQASNDQAPRWFQEGLAQRVEMREMHPNAFNMYEDDRLIAASLLDAVLSGSPDPEMIGEAYVESQTVIRYIETAKGAKAIPSMIAAFRDGATTEEAIQQVMNIPIDEFDLKLRQWGRSGARVFENPPPARYDIEDEGPKWSKRRS